MHNKEEFINKKHYTFEELRELVGFLRSDQGCPWDHEQTHSSVKAALIEEAYEAVDAIDNNDQDNFIEELGDVFLQVLFHADIAENDDSFTMQAIIDRLAHKLISRHSHVFGQDEAKDVEDVLNLWEKNKEKEKEKSISTTPISDKINKIPKAFPPLLRSRKIQKILAKHGFDWTNIEDVEAKVKEEWNELKDSKTIEEKKEEFGDLLFVLVHYANWLGIQAEEGLIYANEKMIKRFKYFENLITTKGLDYNEVVKDEVLADEIWQEAKKIHDGE